MKTRYIFGASLPRSGTKLYTYALSTNQKILIAPNPNVELFRFLKIGSLEFSKRLLKYGKVAVAPGIGFGENGEGFVRIGLVENEYRIRQAIKNVKLFFDNYEV